MGHLPHFIIIGAMKAGTTTLYAWLTDGAGAPACAAKEPNFFSDNFELGIDWYQSRFADGPAPYRGGEASTQYTGYKSDIVAPRMRAAVPDVRLVYLLRDPAERLRSHYRYDVLRARERRPFEEAIRASRLYVGYSSYWSRLRPFIDAFPAEQILVTRAEDLFGPSDDAWREVLAHVGLDAVARPDFSRNVSATKRLDSPLKRWAIGRGVRNWRKAIPQPLWRAGSRLLTRDQTRAQVPGLLAGDHALPDDIAAALDQEVHELSRWLGRAPLWP